MIGKLYVFEGSDGSGKTTLAKAVQAELTKRDVRCTYTKEPTDEGSKRLADPDICNPVESMLIFMQDRLRHTREMAKTSGTVKSFCATDTTIQRSPTRASF